MTIGATICSWCLPKVTVIKPGDPKLPVSHGLCSDCKAKLEREVA